MDLGLNQMFLVPFTQSLSVYYGNSETSRSYDRTLLTTTVDTELLGRLRLAGITDTERQGRVSGGAVFGQVLEGKWNTFGKMFYTSCVLLSLICLSN